MPIEGWEGGKEHLQLIRWWWGVRLEHQLGETLPNKLASLPALVPSQFKTCSFKVNPSHVSFRKAGHLTTSFLLTKSKTKQSKSFLGV